MQLMTLKAFFFSFSIWLDVPHLTNEHRTQDCIASHDSTEEIDTAISLDDSWQRGGFSSHNGVVTAIAMDTGKVIDIEPMSRFCKACSLEESIKTTNPREYNDWKDMHTDCPISYRGSAPGMECVGDKRMFHRSLDKYGLRYTVRWRW